MWGSLAINKPRTAEARRYGQYHGPEPATGISKSHAGAPLKEWVQAKLMR